MSCLVFISTVVCAAPVALPRPEIIVCASANASPAIAQAADELAHDATDVPALQGLLTTQDAGPAVRMTSEALLKQYDLAAYNHLVVVGLRGNDPLVDRVWENYATIDEADKSIYMQGWGHLRGDIGYVEGDRNPFLHSRRIKAAPFETVLFKLSGTSEAGVLAGVKAFEGGLFNGLVPAGDFTRPETTLLDLDPLVAPAPMNLPPTVTMKIHGTAAEAPLVGWTQPPGNEYRAYIDVAGYEPLHLWRYKYLEPHALDRAQTPGWMAGFHRMAYGNAVNIAEFKSPAEAEATARAIGKSGGGWNRSRDVAGLPTWQNNQPIDENMAASLGKVTVTWKGSFVLMSTLPPDAFGQVLMGLK